MDRYWVGNSGNWTDTAHWASSSGGSGGETVPTSGDNAIFDSNSITSSGQTITSNGGSANNIDFSGVANNPTLHFNDYIFCYGGITFSATMLVTSSSYQYGVYFSGPGQVNSNGLSLGNITLLFDEDSDCEIVSDLEVAGIDAEDCIGLKFSCSLVKLIGDNPRWFVWNPSSLDMGSCDLEIVVTNPSGTLLEFHHSSSFDVQYNDISFEGYTGTEETGATFEVLGNGVKIRMTMGVLEFKTPMVVFLSGSAYDFSIRSLLDLDGFILEATEESPSWIVGWHLDLYKASGIVALTNTTISGVVVGNGGNARFRSYLSNGCVDDGDNSGWDWGLPPRQTVLST
jgi:hypothetical protein